MSYDIAELKRNTDNVIVGEIEFLRVELTTKNEIKESFLLSQSMLRDEFLCSYKYASGKISREGICYNRSVNSLNAKVAII